MTATELKTRFNIELDAVASAAAPGFTDAEIGELLTKAQDIQVEMYTKLKDWNSIYTLVKHNHTVTLNSDSTYYGSGAKYVNLPSDVSDFRYYVTSRVKVTRTYPSLTTQYVECELIDRSYLNRFLSGGFNVPYFKKPKVALEYRTASVVPVMVVVPDYYTSAMEGFELSYVKIPTEIDIVNYPSRECELPEFLHKEMVSMAVQEAVRSLYISKIPQKEQ